MKEDRKSIGGLREITRLFAVQILYSSDILKKNIVDVIREQYPDVSVILSEDITLNEVSREFLDTLIGAYSAHVGEIDAIIISHLSSKWTMERLNKVLLSILRLGVSELLYIPEVPANVTFNEYVEIGKAFLGKADVSFINGLLNAVYKADVQNLTEACDK